MILVLIGIQSAEVACQSVMLQLQAPRMCAPTAARLTFKRVLMIAQLHWLPAQAHYNSLYFSEDVENQAKNPSPPKKVLGSRNLGKLGNKLKPCRQV